MIRRLALVACATSLALLAACATTPSGAPDCSQAPNQRAIAETAIAAADLAYSQAVTFCKEGPDGDKCRTIAAQALAASKTAAQIAILAINTRCPPTN